MDNRERAAVQALHTGDPITAVVHATAILGNGEVTQAHLLAGVAWTMAGDWYQGESHLLEALGGDTGDSKPHALYNLAICYEHQNRTDLAASLYTAAAAGWREHGQDTNAAKAHLNAAWMLACRERIAEAALHLSAAESEPSVRFEHVALSAYLELLHGSAVPALSLATIVEDQCESPWPLTLACYVAGIVKANVGDIESAKAYYGTGKTLLDSAKDVRLMNLYVSLRTKL